MIFLCHPLRAESSGLTWGSFKAAEKISMYRNLMPSGRIIVKAMKYTPLIAVTGAVFATGFILNEYSLKEDWSNRDFYYKLTLIPVNLIFTTSGSVLFILATAPLCLAAGIAATPVAGMACTIAAGMTGYGISSVAAKHIHEILFNIIWPEPLLPDTEQLIELKNGLGTQIDTTGNYGGI